MVVLMSAVFPERSLFSVFVFYPLSPVFIIVSYGPYWYWRSDAVLAGPNDIHDCSFCSKV